MQLAVFLKTTFKNLLKCFDAFRQLAVEWHTSSNGNETRYYLEQKHEYKFPENWTKIYEGIHNYHIITGLSRGKQSIHLHPDF